MFIFRSAKPSLVKEAAHTHHVHNSLSWLFWQEINIYCSETQIRVVGFLYNVIFYEDWITIVDNKG